MHVQPSIVQTAANPRVDYRNSALRAQAMPAGSSPKRERLSWLGVTAFCLGIAQSGSAVGWARLDVGGLLVHPYLLVVAAFLLPVAGVRLHLLPRRLLGAGALFLACFAVSEIAGDASAAIIVKAGATLVSMIFAAMLVSNRRDFLAGVVGFVLGVSGMAVRGLAEVSGQSISPYGLNPMQDVANKNSYSVYAVPAVYLALAVVLYFRPARFTKLVLLASSAIATLSVFGSTNRSGWLALALVPLFLVTWRRTLPLFLGTLLIASTTVWFLSTTEYGKVFQRRVDETRAGYSSDPLRADIYRAALPVLVDHPLLGTSPSGLERELPQRVGLIFWERLAAHSVVVLIVAGTGLLGIASFSFLAVTLWRIGSLCVSSRGPGRPWIDPGSLLQRLMILWLVRGLFTDEILYSGTFSIGLGLLLGLHLQEVRRSLANARSHDGPVLARAGLSPRVSLGRANRAGAERPFGRPASLVLRKSRE